MYLQTDKHKSFVSGPISPELITGVISEHQLNTETGAHSLFLGQVRADQKDKSKVTNITYSCYEEMAEKEFEKIKLDAMKLYKLQNIYILHSLGEVRTGEVSMLVMVTSAHRENCLEALKFIVNEIKTKVPVWKKEIYEDGSFRWVE